MGYVYLCLAIVAEGVGIAAISMIGVFVFKQPIDFPAVLGIAMIASSVVVINVFSTTATNPV